MEHRRIIKGKKLGTGAYGIVYRTIVKSAEGEDEEFALKRNLSTVDVKGIEVVRELNFLATLNHPLVVKLVEVSLGGDPFDNAPMSPKNYEDDKCHFLLEKADTDLRKYLKKGKPKNMKKIKSLMCQICIGMEYIHSKGIIHRDIKPDNILLKKADGCISAIITDFGLSSKTTKYRPSTPGVVSSWFRAPEIASRYTYYDTKTDVWAVGCLLYEMASFKPFVSPDNPDRCVMDDISKAHPSVTEEDWEKFLSKAGRRFDIKYRSSQRGFKDLIYSRNKPLASGDVDFDEESGKFSDFIDLLEKMMKINPDERCSMTEVLDHPFFGCWASEIQKMRERYNQPKEEKIYIHNCIERAWACNIALNIYNNRGEYKWYSHHAIFHALRIFDDHLHAIYTSPETTFRDRVTRDMGKIYTYNEVSLYFYTCIYLAIKFLYCLRNPPSWKKVFPNRFNKRSYIEQSEIFEERLLQDSEYNFIHLTFIDILDKESCKEEDKEYNIRKAMLNYCHVSGDFEGDIKLLYDRQYK